MRAADLSAGPDVKRRGRQNTNEDRRMRNKRGIGVCMLSTTSIDEYLKVARVADEVGLDSIWVAEGYHFFRDLGEPRSATTIAAAIAMTTKRIRIGLGIVPPFTRHPSLLAMEAVSLSELSGGRFMLGLGAAKAASVHMDMGPDKLKPVPMHRDAITIIRALLKGEALDYRGKVFTLDAPARRREDKVHDVPIAVGATGPLMLKLAGAMADIILLPTFTTPAFVSTRGGRSRRGCASRAARSTTSRSAPRCLSPCIATAGRRAMRSGGSRRSILRTRCRTSETTR